MGTIISTALETNLTPEQSRLSLARNRALKFPSDDQMHEAPSYVTELMGLAGEKTIMKIQEEKDAPRNKDKPWR